MAELEFTVRGEADAHPRYQVADFVAHENDVDAEQRMLSGHYVAYTSTKHGWFKLNDESVSELLLPLLLFRT